uniref:TFIIB-type domain-containing protein n=1 Tax=Macrostomum lignano TaxID=282301 RepID=A0A1I8HS06_9PLAT
KLCQFCNGEVARATLSHDKACLDCGAVQDQAVKVDSATGATVLMGSCELVTDPDAARSRVALARCLGVSNANSSANRAATTTTTDSNKLLLRTPLGRRMSRRLVGLSQTLGIRNQSDLDRIRLALGQLLAEKPNIRESGLRGKLACVLHLLCPGNAFYSLLSPDGAARHASSEVAADAAALTDTLASSWRASSIARSRLRRLGLYLALMKHGLTKNEILTALAGPINRRDLHLFSEAKEQALRLLRLHPLLQHRADLTEAQLHRYLQDLIDWRQRLVKERLALVGDADCPL